MVAVDLKKLRVLAVATAIYTAAFAVLIPATIALPAQKIGLVVDVAGTSLNGNTLEYDDDMAGELALEMEAEPNAGSSISVRFRCPSAEFTLESIMPRTPIRREELIGPDGFHSTKLDISLYEIGVFIDIRWLSNGSASVYAALDIDDSQYSLVGIVPRMMKPEWVDTHTFYVNQPEVLESLTQEQLPSTSLVIRQTSQSKDNPESHRVLPAYFPPSEPRVYCVVHEVFFDDNNSVPEQVGSWCKSYSWVDYSVYREDVSEAQIKSDLQFYNKKHYTIDYKSRILGAYEIDTHGNTDVSEPDRPLLTFDGGEITPSEVVNLWGPYSSDYYIRPDSAIVLASACRSLRDGGISDVSEMGDAFIDYGASAYIGSTLDTPVEMDEWTEEFWWSLTYEDETIGKAIGDANLAIGWQSTSSKIQVYLPQYKSRSMPN